MNKDPIIRLENTQMYFRVSQGFKKKYLKAVDDVTFSIYPGETIGLVGESGCGKSTLGKTIAGLYKNTGGSIYFHGKDINELSGQEYTKYRKNVQMVFQDPTASLNPRMRVRQIIAEPLLFHPNVDNSKMDDLIKNMVKVVGLQEDALDRFPHEFSGGQQQRIGIARAIIGNPEFIICDEAVSALDVSVQAQVLNLLKKLKTEYNLTYLFISHNLSVVKHMCDRIVVMYLGKVIEIGTRDQIFDNPLHPYTKALISAIPVANAEKKVQRIVLEGDLPSPINVPEGCAFHNRCYECQSECNVNQPELIEYEAGHWVCCSRYSL